MVNSFVFMGYLRNYCESENGIKFLISHHTKDGNFVIPIYMNFKPTKKIMSILKEDMLLAFKGSISLDEENQIIIIADKLSMLSVKEKDGENNESN